MYNPKYLKEKEEKERLEKEKKYKNFLKKNEGKYDNIIENNGIVTLYIAIDTLDFNE